MGCFALLKFMRESAVVARVPSNDVQDAISRLSGCAINNVTVHIQRALALRLK